MCDLLCVIFSVRSLILKYSVTQMFDEQVQLYKLTNGICYDDLYWIGIFVFDFYTLHTQTFNLIRVFNYQVFMEYLLVFDDLLIFAVWLIFYL